ncbi:MAG: helix-turn-helix domain-containing protein [Alphaproteobacteria bacterium]
MLISPLSMRDDYCANIVISSVALEFGVSPFDPAKPKERGSGHVVMARQICLYLLHTVFQLTLSRAGRAVKRHATTARYACEMVEASREDPVFDARLQRLETFLRSAPCLTGG